MNFVWGLLDYYVFNRLLNVRIVSDDLFSDDDDTRADPSSSLRAHSRRGRRETTRLLEQTTPEQAESPTTSIVIPSSSVRGLRADRDRIDHGITRTLTASPEEQRRRMRSNSLWDRSHQQHTTQHRDLERRGTTIGVGASVGASVGAGATNAGAGVGPRADPVVTFAEDAQREREKERRGSRELRQELELQKEKDCLTIQSLQSENASLQTKINALQSSLNGSIAQLTTLQSQHLALRRQHDELRRSHDALQLKHSHFTALAQSHASTSTDLSRMTARYDGLRKAYGDLAREAEDGKEELKSLRGFLNRTDEWSGAQIIQNVQDLNGEAVQLAASIADEFCSASITPGPGAGGMSFAPRSLPSSPPRPRARSRTTSTSIQSSSGSHFHLLLPRNSSTELVQQTLSEPLLALLHSHDHSSDPTLVQFAIQAWLVKCCTLVFEAFYFGLDDKVDGLLKEMWEDICRTEPQPTASRWRALTYNLTRASTANLPTSSSSRPHHHAADSISNLTNTFILGLHTILQFSSSPLSSFVASPSSPSFVGSPSPISPMTPGVSPVRPSRTGMNGIYSAVPGAGTPASPIRIANGGGQSHPQTQTQAQAFISVESLKERYSASAGRIFGDAAKLNEILKVGVMSGWFEVLCARNINAGGEFGDFGGVGSVSRLRSWSSSTSPVGISPNRSGSLRIGNGRVRGSLRKVGSQILEGEASHFTSTLNAPVQDQGHIAFDPSTMENVYKDVLSPSVGVAVGVGGGRDKDKEAREREMERGQAVLCTVELGLVCTTKKERERGKGRRKGSFVGGAVSGGEGENEFGKVGRIVEETNWLVKPKVLLESVKEML